jgi:hypothetical protein
MKKIITFYPYQKNNPPYDASNWIMSFFVLSYEKNIFFIFWLIFAFIYRSGECTHIQYTKSLIVNVNEKELERGCRFFFV